MDGNVDPARLATERHLIPVSAYSDALPPYELLADLSGEITSIGSSTTTNLVARAGAHFQHLYPNVTLHVTSSPASIGPSALLDGRADIVPMSRPLTPEEISQFAARYRYPPTEVKVAADALAIYVENSNPVSGLTMEQLDGMFSRTLHLGGSSIETWGQVGLTDEWRDRPIILYGYRAEDGAYQTFRQRALAGGEFRLSMRVPGGGSSIVQGVAAVPGSVGFASIFFACERVRAVSIAGSDGRFHAPTRDSVHSHGYPLSRFLYVCVNKIPSRPLEGPAAEFLQFLLSREGQQIVANGGNIPLDTATVMEGRRLLAGSE